MELEGLNKAIEKGKCIYIDDFKEQHILYTGYYKMLDLLVQAIEHTSDLDMILKLTDRYITIMEKIQDKGIRII